MENNAISKNSKRLKIVLALIFIVFLGIGISQFLAPHKFQVVSTNPNIARVSSAVPFFDINFNKSLVSNSLQLTSTPNIIKSYSVKDKTVDITLNPLTVNTSYTITVESVTATNHSTLTNQTFHFTATYISPADLPKDQQQAILHNQESFSSPANDPIVAHLPYQTLSFTLNSQVTTGASGEPALVLQAQLFLSQADMTDQAAATARDKQMVLDYISSLGFDPTKYTINYTVVTP